MKTLRTMMAILGSLAVASCMASCTGETAHEQQQEAKVTQALAAEDQGAIRALDARWAKALASKDAAQAASFYAEDASLLAPGVPMVTGKEAIEKTLAEMMRAPGFALRFAPTKINVSSSGDLAYEWGDYSLTRNDAKGKPETSKGKYVVVWGKRGDAGWKALLDVPTTTP